MTPPDVPPDNLSVPLASLVALGVEHWRLSTWLAASAPAAGAGPARHALRRMEEFLRQCDLEVRGLDGRPFDPGLAARVVDTTEDPALPPGQSVVAETLSPMVLYCGRVIRPADVVTREGPKR